MLFNYKIIINQIKLGATEKKIKIKIPKAQKKLVKAKLQSI